MVYIPLGVPYNQLFPKRSWEVVPGLTLKLCPKELSKLFAKGTPAKYRTFGVNYVIRIDVGVYIDNAKKRLDQTLKKNKTSSLGFDPHTVVTNLLLALVTEAPNTGCRFSGYYSGREEKSEFIATGHAHHEQQDLSYSRVEYSSKKQLNRKRVRDVFCHLEPYFTPPRRGNVVLLKADRLAVALRGLWSALCTKYDEQAFITFAMTLEALLTTSNLEITHQIAERAAILLGRSLPQRTRIYRQVKRVYGIRSAIVHGSAFPSKKEKKKFTINIHPASNTVPQETLREIGALAFQVFVAAVTDGKLKGIIQQKDNQKLDEYFINRLFGATR